MPIELEAAEEPGEEFEPGQLVYEVLGEHVRDADEATLMTLVGAIQRGDPWPRLPKKLREIFADLEEDLFDDDGA